MRAIAFTLIFFVYIFSTSVWLVDQVLLTHTTFSPVGLDGMPLNTSELVNSGASFQDIGEAVLNPSQGGTVFDRIGQYLLTTYAVIWEMLDLLSGNYAFNVLHTVGVHPAFVTMLKVLFPMFVAFQVIWFLVGRY